MNKIAVSLLALAAATPALGQTSSTPATGAATTSGSDVVVTASRSGDALRIDQLGASVTVIDAEQLEQRQTRIVSDVLRDVPGIAVSRAGNVGGFTQLRLRGSESNHVLVLIDGIEVADPYQGEFDFGTLIADEASRVEVIRGQQSSLYGSDAIGGVIQYLTLTGSERPGYSARVEGGSFGTVTGGARLAGVAGAIDYAVSGSAYRTDGTPTAVGGARDIGDTSVQGTAKVTWSPAPAFKLTGVARYSNTAADTNNTGSDPRSALFGRIVDTPGARFTNEAFYGLVSAELSLADGRWTNALTGQYADTGRSNYDSDGLSFGDRGKRAKGSFVSAFRFGSDAVRQRVTGAVDVEREDFRNTTPSPFTFQGYRHTNNVGVVGEYEAVVDDVLSLGGSVRHDFNTRFADTTTFRTQASYRFAAGTRLRGAYGTGVKNPGYYELYGFSDGRYIGNAGLRPEKSKGWEVGADQSLDALIGGKASIGGTYFDSILQDEIYTTYPAPAYVASPANRATKSRQHGVEVFANARPIDQIRFDLAYTYTHSTENGVDEVRRPHHIASVNTTVFSPDKRLSVTGTVRYNGRQDDLAYTNPNYVPVCVALQEFVLVNLAGEYRLTPAVSLFGRVENLFDEHYQEVFSYATPRRAGYGGVKARF